MGGLRAVPIDVRIVAASNRNIEKAVEDKAFREDLYYRLNVFPIVIPPLRERQDDIPLLAEYFIAKYSAELKTPAKKIAKEAMDLLINYPWKGNVRELENCMERAIILCEGETILPEYVSLNRKLAIESALKGFSMEGPLEETAREAVRFVETRRIVSALKETKGNKSRASELLRVSYKTLLTKIKEYGIES